MAVVCAVKGYRLIAVMSAGNSPERRRILEARGYTVVAAANGAEALEVARGRDVDLLVTDLVMPVVGGRELAARLRAERPSLPALFMSGYAGDAGALPADVPLLRKPFTPDALASAVRSILDGATVPPA